MTQTICITRVIRFIAEGYLLVYLFAFVPQFLGGKSTWFGEGRLEAVRSSGDAARATAVTRVCCRVE